MRRIIAALAVWLLLSVSARAASTDFELLEPPLQPQGTLMTEGAVTGGDPWYVGILLQQEQEPVVAARSRGTQGIEFIEPVYFYRTQLRLLGSWRVHRQIRIGFDLPISLLGDYKFDNKIETAVFKFNDLRLNANLHAWSHAWGKHLLDLALSGGFYLPTGQAEFLTGTDGRILEPYITAIGEYRYRRWTLRLNLGYRERQDTVLRNFNINLGDRFIYKVSGSLRDRSDRIWFAELAGGTETQEFFTSSQYNFLEFYTGLQAKVRKAVVLGGLSLGITRAYGTPLIRFVLATYLGKSAFEKWMAPPPVIPGTLMVEIVDSRSLQPVTQARVEIFAPDAETETVMALSGTAATRLLSGVYLVEARATGYSPITETVEIAAGITTPVRFVLTHEPQNGWLRLQVRDQASREPVSQATVYLRGEGQPRNGTVSDIGVYNDELPAGAYRLTVTAVGYLPKMLELEIADLVTREVEIRMERIVTRLQLRAIDIETRAEVTDAVAYFPELSLVKGIVAGNPIRLEPAGRYSIAVTAPGYFPLKVTFEAGKVTEATLVVEMTHKSNDNAQLSGGQIYITKNIQFRSGSAKIQAVSNPILNDVAKIIREHSEISKVIVHGHTDNRGSRKYNTRLSQRRAESVRKYLTRQGIKPTLFEAIGHGPDEPIADNGTQEGRAANRRVEFEVITQKK